MAETSRSVFARAGKLRLALKSIEGLPLEWEGKVISCRVGIDGYDVYAPGSTVSRGTCTFSNAGDFEYTEASDTFALLEIFDRPNPSPDPDLDPIAVLRPSVEQVVRHDEAREVLTVNELGGAKLLLEMKFVSKPSTIPDNIEVLIERFADLPGPEGIQPYVIALLESAEEDIEIGRTKSVEGNTARCSQTVRGRYDGSQILILQIMDSRNDSLVAEVRCDIWGVVKEEENWSRAGTLELEPSGQVVLLIRLWNDPKEEKAPPAPRQVSIQEPPESSSSSSPVPSETSSQTSSSSSSSSSHLKAAPVSPTSEENRQLVQAARRAADEAAANARKARAAADMAQTALPATRHREAEQEAARVRDAANEAEAAAKRAARDADELARLAKGRHPNIDDLEDLLRSVEDDAEVAANAKTAAADRAKNVARLSAEEAAEQAREASARAHKAAKELRDIQVKNPEIKGLIALADGAEDDEDHAAKYARRARQSADTCADSLTNLEDAVDALSAARRSAREAKAKEHDAQEKLKKAKHLLQKAKRAAEKKKQEELERERLAREQERMARELAREAEHRADIERRMKDANAGDVNEGRMYEGAIATSFGNTARSPMGRPMRLVNTMPFTACCSPKVGTGAPELNRELSSESLNIRLSGRNLRGSPTVSGGERSGSRSRGKPAPDYGTSIVEFQGAAISASGITPRTHFIYRPLPWCWCCGCQCCRCCGEC